MPAPASTVLAQPISNGTLARPGSGATPPWVLVSGGFHRRGGMDKANLALAQYLANQGTQVHVVGYHIDAQLEQHPLVTAHRVSRPGNSYFLGGPLLDFTGRSVARQVAAQFPGARVLVNGTNCMWPGINWVHCVHHVWQSGVVDGPAWFRAKQGLNRWLLRRRERAAGRLGRLFIANSKRTERDLMEQLGIDVGRIRTIYLGAESDWGLVKPQEKTDSRRAMNIPEGRHAAVFLGAIAHDRNKGFDVLLEAWRRLCADPQWDVDLLVAGSGGRLEECREKVAQWGLGERIRLLGFSDRVRDLLAAADVLVSPSRYEAYGLNVQEAICRGVPAIVSARAGVAERYSAEDQALLLPDPEDIDDLVARIRAWRSKMEEWKSRFEVFGNALREYGWQDMARMIVSAVNQQAAERMPPEPAR